MTKPSEELRSFAHAAIQAEKDPRAQALADAVFNVVKYKSGTSDVQDSAAVAFKSGEGVCQDHAQVYLAASSVLGIPARYGSGYLYTGDIKDVATHAWVDVCLGSDSG